MNIVPLFLQLRGLVGAKARPVQLVLKRPFRQKANAEQNPPKFGDLALYNNTLSADGVIAVDSGARV